MTNSLICMMFDSGVIFQGEIRVKGHMTPSLPIKIT